MTEKQLIAGLIVHSLLFSIPHQNTNGKKWRAKLSNALKLQFKKQRDTIKDYEQIIDKASDVFKASWNAIEDKTEISLPHLTHLIVLQNMELFKPFKLNMKHFEALNRCSQVTGLARISSKVAKDLSNRINE